MYQLYSDSLIIIAFPSNSFGNELRTNQEIKTLCQNYFHTTFPLAAKTNVSGSTAHVLFNWLAQQTENGVMNATANKDFCKFLITKEGTLVATFGPDILPTDSIIHKAITHIY